jgi:hypothetical protein
MRDLTIGQGETIRDKVIVEEEGAVSVTFVATDGNVNVIEEVFTFDGLEADVTIMDTIIPPDSYDYYYKIIWDDDSVDYLPDFSNCEGECVLPQLNICEVPGVS